MPVKRRFPLFPSYQPPQKTKKKHSERRNNPWRAIVVSHQSLRVTASTRGSNLNSHRGDWQEFWRVKNDYKSPPGDPSKLLPITPFYDGSSNLNLSSLVCRGYTPVTRRDWWLTTIARHGLFRLSECFFSSSVAADSSGREGIFVSPAWEDWQCISPYRGCSQMPMVVIFEAKSAVIGVEFWISASYLSVEYN